MKSTYKLADSIMINRLGYGGMQLTGPGVFGDAPDRASALKLLKAAAADGINFFDTADSYGPHTNETLIADALQPFKNIVIATKGGPARPGPGQWIPNGDPEYIRKAIDSSLKRLRVSTIDLWQLHRVDSRFSIEETLAPVAQAVQAGKIRFVGLSEVEIPQIEKAQKVVKIISIQNLYNLENRQWEKVLDYTTKNQMAFIPWFPLASGPKGFSSTVQQVADAHHASNAQIALAWLLKRAENILLIPGTKSIDHLRDNNGASKVELTDEEFQKLSKLK